MNKRSEIDNLPRNSDENNVIKNLISKILLSHFSINITCMSNAILSPFPFSREQTRPLSFCHEISLARAQ